MSEYTRGIVGGEYDSRVGIDGHIEFRLLPDRGRLGASEYAMGDKSLVARTRLSLLKE